MIFTLFTAIVFIAELIIAFALIINLIKLDKNVNESNKFISEAKPKIQSIVELMRGISEQITELTPLWVEKFKLIRNKIILMKLSGVMASVLFLSINIKTIKKIRKSKTFKMALKGLSLIQNMV